MRPAMRRGAVAHASGMRSVSAKASSLAGLAAPPVRAALGRSGLNRAPGGPSVRRAGLGSAPRTSRDRREDTSVVCRAEGPEFNPQSVTVTIGGRELTLETGEVGRQADGSIMATEGETVILTTACAGNAMGDGSFVPFQVQYQERFSAAGRTSGGFIKRDGKAKDPEVLTSRLIDRPLRPLFDEGWQFDTQVLSWVLSYDDTAAPEPMAITAAATSLLISSIPFRKSVVGVRVGMDRESGAFIVNPTTEQMRDSPLDLMLAGTRDAILMIEGYCELLTEAQMLEAIESGHAEISRVAKEIEAWAAGVGKEKRQDGWKQNEELQRKVEEMAAEEFRKIYKGPNQKKVRAKAIRQLKESVTQKLTPFVVQENLPSDPEALAFLAMEHVAVEDMDEDDILTDDEEKPAAESVPPDFSIDSMTDIKIALKKCESSVMRSLVLEEGLRADGRDITAIRPIAARCGLLPRTHGSALFTRGETQSIAVCTLGDKSSAQRLDSMQLDAQDWEAEHSRFMLQYFFPPSSVGETGRFGPPGRREMGHGKLAERALVPVLPDGDDFPYVMRVESTITESNGSSSMASVCGGCLALQDAGVPIKAPVAGVAMGLVLEPDGRFTVLSDILGSEDALGDMDFKVAGTMDAVTAFQMDIKVEGITVDIMRQALEQARVGRRHIIEEMSKADPPPKNEMSDRTPRLARLAMPAAKIPALIGPQGKIIKALTAAAGVSSIQMDQDLETCEICAPDRASLERALNLIQVMTAEPQPGQIYRNARVDGVSAFGVFVEILPGKSGLVHISELDTSHVADAGEMFEKGDKMDVMLMEILDNGKMKLSRKEVLQHDKKGTPTSPELDASLAFEAMPAVEGRGGNGRGGGGDGNGRNKQREKPKEKVPEKTPPPPLAGPPKRE
ncbi:unnamed protein product [Pedinophyceae sp. YPF-701]|nr:unnamed protein product [Pedinophyceae sp. YPF-701]